MSQQNNKENHDNSKEQVREVKDFWLVKTDT